MKLLVQADDYGFTKGVTAGIIDGIENGILRNTGMFTNMPGAIHAATLIPDHPQACFGIDFNLVSGPSIANPSSIPHLVDGNGWFIRSNVRIKDARWQTEEGRLELFPADEVLIEIQAQYDRFIELVGKKPGYLHTHSLGPESYVAAIAEVAHANDVPFSRDIRDEIDFFRPLFGAMRGEASASVSKTFNPMEQINKDPEGIFWANKEEMLTHEYVNIGGHCGFVDAELFALTSLSIERARDHQLVTSKRICDWVAENDVQLITYYDLV